MAGCFPPDGLRQTQITRCSTLEHSRSLDSFLAGIERRAFRMAHIATGDTEDALDIVQDAMCKLVEKYSTRQPGEWGPLFQTILQSRINDWYRRTFIRNRFRVWFGREDDEHDSDPIQTIADDRGRSPEQHMQSARSMDALDQAIRDLPGRQQQAFMIRIFEGLDIAETAVIMKCSEGSVKTHYSRAVHTLREKLGDHWP